jgi:dihydroorotase-like cyclic amidohydrolase
VSRGIYEPFATRLVERTRGLRLGDPLDLQTQIGPLVSKAQREKTAAAVDKAREQGAPCWRAVGALWAAGVAFFKVFTCTTHGVPGHDAAALKSHLEASALAGAVSLMHCEDESLTEGAESMLQAAGRDDPGVLPEWRNRDAELVAAAVAALLVRRTGARATTAHKSNDEVASYIAAERARGATIGAEDCPQYFLLREDDVHEHGAKVHAAGARQNR